MSDRMTTFKETFKGEERISLPLLQKTFGLSYKDAKDFYKELSLRKWVGRYAQGIFYPVNTAYIAGRELESGEYDRLARNLDEDELTLFCAIARKNRMGEGFVPEDPQEELMAKVFASQSLLHRFEGAYFVSLSSHGQRCIDNLIAEKTENICIRYIARPILCGIIEKGKFEASDRRLLSLPFMPEECRTYVENGMERYEMEGWRPSAAGTEQPPRENVLRFELIEAMVRACDYETKEEYDRNAKMCATVIGRSAVCGKWYKEAAKAAAAEICTELTFGNLKEIRRILLSTPDFNGDED